MLLLRELRLAAVLWHRSGHALDNLSILKLLLLWWDAIGVSQALLLRKLLLHRVRHSLASLLQLGHAEILLKLILILCQLLSLHLLLCNSHLSCLLVLKLLLLLVRVVLTGAVDVSQFLFQP